MKIREFNTPLQGSYEVSEADGKACTAFLSDSLLKTAMGYFFRKATLEIKHFLKPKSYEQRTVLKEDILYHTGRILTTREIDGNLGLADVCVDLSAITFCVPVSDSHSPVACAIVNEKH